MRESIRYVRCSSARLRAGMVRIGLGLMFGGLALAGGCASQSGATGSGDRADTSAPGFADTRVLVVDTDAMRSIGYRRDWISYPPLRRGFRMIDVVKFDGMIGVLGGGNSVTLIDDRSGQVRWTEIPTERSMRLISLSPVTYRGSRSLLMSSESRGFIIDRDTGALQTIQEYDRVINTGPIVYDRLAIFGTSSGEIVAHDVQVAQRRWGANLEGAVQYGPTAMDGLLAAVTVSGMVRFYDPIVGSLLGRARMLDGVASEPATDGQVLYLTSLDQSVYAIAPSGRTLWRYPTESPLRTSPEVIDGTVYFEDPTRGLTALDASTGQRRWIAGGVRGRVLGVLQGRLLVWDGQRMTLLLPSTGSVDLTADLPGIDRLMLDAKVNGNLYVTGRFGGVAKYVPTIESLSLR